MPGFFLSEMWISYELCLSRSRSPDSSFSIHPLPYNSDLINIEGAFDLYAAFERYEFLRRLSDMKFGSGIFQTPARNHHYFS